MAETGSESQNISDITLRPALEGELEETHQMISLEDDWYLRMNKFQKIFETFGGVYVAVTSKGDVAGTVGITPTYPDECVLGNFIVNAKYRGKGLGKRMLAEVQRIYANLTITLTSVPVSKGFYRSRPLLFSFVLLHSSDGCIGLTSLLGGAGIFFCAHNVRRFPSCDLSKCGFHEIGQSHEVIILEVSTTEVENKLCPHDDVIVSTYTPDIFEELCQYDSLSRGYNMSRYLSVMAETNPHLFVARFKTSGKIAGYGGCLHKESTVILDGLFADNDNVALRLYWNVLNAYPDRTEIRVQTIGPRMFLTTFGKILRDKCQSFSRFANGDAELTSLHKLYNVTDCDFSS